MASTRQLLRDARARCAVLSDGRPLLSGVFWTLFDDVFLCDIFFHAVSMVWPWGDRGGLAVFCQDHWGRFWPRAKRKLE